MLRSIDKKEINTKNNLIKVQKMILYNNISATVAYIRISFVSTFLGTKGVSIPFAQELD